MSFPLETTTLKDVRDWLRAKVRGGEALPCPVCTQRVQVYRRKINSRQARTLIEVYRAKGTDWCHVPSTVTYNGDSGEISKLRYWGLVEETTEKREDGGRAGWWRITARGEHFVLGHVRVEKYAVIFDGRRLSLDSSAWVSIRDAIGDHFDYDELMGGG